jgi:DNA-binding GntR family transcriptional regulator
MKAIKRKPMVTDVATQIRSAILEGALVPGSKIAQDALAAGLGVSRLPVRQALLVLQREGLVFLDHGRGAVVAPLDVKFIADLFDCRAIIEGHVAAVLAARRDFDPAPLRRIVDAGREAARRGESRRDLITEFHTAMYDAVGNQVLVQIMNPLLDHVQRAVVFVQSRTADATPAGRRAPGPKGLRSQMATWDEHAEILEAVATRRVGRARALARAHVERVKQVVVAFLVSAAPAARTSLFGTRNPRTPSVTLAPHLTAIIDAARRK